MSTFDELWAAQLDSQAEMGLNPVHMTDRERSDEVTRMIVGLHEQATQLAGVACIYKRHVLRSQPFDRGNITERVVDVMKYAMAIAQMHGLSPEEVFATFLDKTRVVLDQVRGERLSLQQDARVLAVDIDDVVADLSDWPTMLSTLSGGTPRRHHDLLETYKDELHTSGKFRTLSVIPGAREALQKFKAAGWTIVLVTARPHWQYKRIYSDTLYWLDRNEIPRDLLLFNKDKVEAIHRDLAPAWPKAFVEDHPRNALALASAGVHVLLYDRPHNADAPRAELIRRVYNWQEITDTLLGDQ